LIQKYQNDSQADAGATRRKPLIVPKGGELLPRVKRLFAN